MSKLARLLLLPFEAVMVLFIVLDEIARPLYRPLLRWVASLRGPQLELLAPRTNTCPGRGDGFS